MLLSDVLRRRGSLAISSRSLGKRLHAAIREDEAFSILDADPDLAGSDWGQGGCAVLAAALLRLLPGAQPVAVVQDGVAQHYLVRHDGMLLDEHGAMTDASFWREWERYYPDVSRATGARLVTLDRSAELSDGEILCPVGVVSRLVTFLVPRLGVTDSRMMLSDVIRMGSRSSSVFASLRPGSVSEIRDQLQRLSREDLARLQEELNAMDDMVATKYATMTRLYHGAPRSITDRIRTQGFKRVKGRRSGFLGATWEVENLAIFLAEEKRLASAFGGNRVDRPGDLAETLEVFADIQHPLDMTVWARVPKSLRVIGERLVGARYGTKRVTQGDMYWLIDQPEFVDAVKAQGYDAVRFLESADTVKSLGMARKGEVTVAVFDPSRLHIAPPARGTLASLMWHLDQRSR